MPARRKVLAEPVKIRLKKNDVVKVIAGRDKGKQGRVIEIDRRTGRVVVEHVMMVKRHTKPNPGKQIKGGIAERESAIHVSNVMLVGSDGKPTRIGMKVEKIGNKERRTREVIAASKK